MKKAADSTHDSELGRAGGGASASPPIASSSNSHIGSPSSARSHDTVEKADGERPQRSQRSAASGAAASSSSSPGYHRDGATESAAAGARDSEHHDDVEVEDDGYSSYSSYYDSYEEDEETSDSFSNSSEGGADGTGSRAGSPSPASPPPQEDLLRFLSFTLEDAALKDHRLMTMEAFRQVLLLGTNQGAVAVVDAASGKLKDLLFNHRDPISDVDCSANELYVASSDKAGYVSVQSRRDPKDLWISQLGMPIESIALHPLYHKMDSCPMVCAGGSKVILLTKGMLWNNSRRVTTLQENRGRVYRVRWCHRAALDVVAWLSEQEITLYDIKNEAVVRRVGLPGDMPQNMLYPPTLRWERLVALAGSNYISVVDEASTAANNSHNSAVLLCGWGDVVQELRVTSAASTTAAAAAAAAANFAAVAPGNSGATNSNGGGGAVAGLGALPSFPVSTSLTAPFQQRPTAGAASAPSKPPQAPATSAATTQSASPRASAAAPSIASAALTAGTTTRSPYTVELRTLQPLRPSRTAFPYRVCGIAPYGPQRYVILASLVDPYAEGVMKDLEVRVVERSTLVDVYRGRMPVRFIHPLQLRLTYMEPIQSLGAVGTTPGGGGSSGSGGNRVFFSPSPLDPLDPSPRTQYFILSVDTIVKATPADMDDHVEFLMRTQQFEKAYTYAALHARQLRRHVLQQVGHQWLLHLFEVRATDSTAILKVIELLPELVPHSNSLAWEQWIYCLDTCGESWRLVALLPGRSAASKVYNFGDAASPTGSPVPNADAAAAAPTLQVPIRREYYDLVLLRCLRHDANLFYAALHKFDTLFTVPVVLKAAEAAYREHCSSHAWWAVAEDDDDDGEERYSNSKRSHHAKHNGAAAEGEMGKQDEEESERKNKSKSKCEREEQGTDGTSEVSLTSPSTKLARRETAASRDDNGTACGRMNRTARWSLAASYGFLLRCAGRFEEAMQTLMLLPASPRSDRELFGLIQSEQLFRKTLQLLPELLQRREDATLELLMTHVAPPSQQQQQQQRGASPRFVSDESARAPSPSPPASPSAAVDAASPPPSSSLPQRLELFQFGSAEDPLNVESVVDRLESSDRLHLLRYLDLVKEMYPKRFVDTARRHAQLVATLYIDYDRSSLLPFLKQMSMYVERIRELHALCHKNNFVEEEIFLLFRMGREEEALRILIEKMHDLHRALEFVVSIPDREEQTALFARLVDFTVHYNASLPCRRKPQDDDEFDAVDDDGYAAAVASGGIRYVLHQTQPGETYASIAQHYHVAVEDLRKANWMSTPGSRPGSGSPSPPPSSPPKKNNNNNGGSSNNSNTIHSSGSSPRGVYALTNQNGGFAKASSAPEQPPPARCIVPLNLFGSLLDALADPQFSEHPALDVRLVLKRLPSDEPIPHAGASVAAIAHTMAEETAFLSTVTEVGEHDLMGYYAQLLKRRTAAIVMGQGISAQASAAGATTKASAATAAAAPLPASDAASVGVVHRCAACHQLVTQHVVVFGCQHMYHPGCVLQYVRDSTANDGLRRGQAARLDGGGGDAGAANPSENPEEALRKLSVYCRVCRQQTGDHH